MGTRRGDLLGPSASWICLPNLWIDLIGYGVKKIGRWLRGLGGYEENAFNSDQGL